MGHGETPDGAASLAAGKKQRFRPPSLQRFSTAEWLVKRGIEGDLLLAPSKIKSKSPVAPFFFGGKAKAKHER
jgi:hypothetical protein